MSHKSQFVNVNQDLRIKILDLNYLNRYTLNMPYLKVYAIY